VKSQKTLNTLRFHDLTKMSPNAKLEMQTILTQWIASLFFPKSHPTTLTPPVTSSSSLSHTFPDSLPLFPFPFPQQIKKSLSPDLERSWRDKGKN
jgi:hypothetical protein